MKTQIKKEQNFAFGKDVFLLGQDKEGIKYWLEAPKFNCGWYWGFGYVETYTNNNNPGKAKDINSHQHIDSSFIGKMDGGEYVHNIYDCPKLNQTTFSKDEGWVLTELFNTFYQLREQAALYGRGGMHTTTNPLTQLLTDQKQCDRINQVLIPAVTAKIIEILTP